MKLKYLLPAAMLATAATASAVPAYPGLLERTLEDGSKVMVRLNGDEYFHYLTDENGFLLTQEGGKLSYRMDNGSKVMATPELMERMQAEAEAAEPVKVMRAAGMQRMASLTREGRSTFQTLGDFKFLVLLVQFDDVKFNSPTIRQDMDDMLNKEGYNKNGCFGSIRDYYMVSSNGKFRPHFDVSEVITLPKTSAYYTGGKKYANVREMVEDAVKAADPNVDFSQYSTLQEGVCDAVIIWYAGYGQADTGDETCIWPHQSTLGHLNIMADNTKIDTYCCFNELNGGTHYTNKDYVLAGIGTPIHEMGHVMGMPDLYDPAYKVKSTPGNWSIFDKGPYLGDSYCPPTYSAYERWLFNWIDYEDVVDETRYELPEISKEGRALRIPVLSNKGQVYNSEYFVLESRNKSGWDSYLPNSGMLIWHIDYSSPSAWVNNTVNSTEARKRCHLVTADGSANFVLGNTNVASINAAWPYGDRDYLTPDTDITLDTNYLFANSATGDSFITDIKHDSETGVTTLAYNVLKETPVVTTQLAMPTRGKDSYGEPNNDITFTWDPVEGATGYKLTVFRQSAGRIYYESGLDEKNVGNVTSYTLESLSRTKLPLEFTAYVRVVTEMPSLEKSNEVVFIPNNLEAVSGIGDIADDDMTVIGLEGAILAPQGAEIYDMQGVRRAAEGLAPGIYMVRCGQKVTKAVVK